MTEYRISKRSNIAGRSTSNNIRVKIVAKDINDLRKKLIANGTVKDFSYIEILSSDVSGNRPIGDIMLVDIIRPRVEPPSFEPVKVGSRYAYVLWMPRRYKYEYAGKSIFVNPKNGKLDDGHYLTNPIYDRDSPFRLLRQ